MTRRPAALNLQKDTAIYPDLLETHLGDAAPASLAIWSANDFDLSRRSFLALFSSGKAPASVLLTVHDLAQTWREAGRVVIGGFHSPVEQEALTILLRPPGRTVLCPARSLHRMRLKAEWRDAFDEGRLTLLSPFPDYVRRPTRETAYRRNQMVAALADTILIAHARPNSSTWRLTEEVMAWDKPVYTLPHKANESLLDLGVRPWPDGKS